MSSITLDITPTTRVLESLGATGGRPYQAIAEFIDNAVDSATKNDLKSVNVNLIIKNQKGKTQSITIEDNAFGMELEDLERAFKLGASNKNTEELIGRFGMGMKTAISSLGGSFSVITATSVNPKAYEVAANLHELKDFTLNGRQIKKSFNHGTHIHVSKCERVNYNILIKDLNNHLPVIFRHHLKEGFLNLTLNGNPIKAKHYQCMGDDGCYIDFTVKVDGVDIKGWAGISVPTHGDYGFSLLKNKRTISPFSKIAIGGDPAYSRIIGELHLDHFETDHHKTKFEQYSNKWDLLESALKKELKDLLAKAKELYVKANDKSEENVQRSIPELVNQLNDIINADDLLKEFLNDGRQGLSLAGVFNRLLGGDTSKESESSESKTTNKNKNSNKRKNPGIQIEHNFHDLGVDSPKKKWSYDGVLRVTTNTAHPLFPGEPERKNTYSRINIMDSMAHHFAGQSENTIESYQEILDRLQRGAKIKGILI